MALYAAFDIKKGTIDARTIYPTKRGAMVNWLWLNEFNVTQAWPDEAIAFNFKASGHLVSLAEIEITVTAQSVELEG